MSGNIIIGERNGNGYNGKATPHPTLIGGENPRVQMAGILTVENGKIVSYNHMSGHFKPNIKSMDAAHKAFGRLPSYLFKGGKKKWQKENLNCLTIEKKNNILKRAKNDKKWRIMSNNQV